MGRNKITPEQREAQRKLFRLWKARLENGKLNNKQANKRAKSLSRKRIEVNYENH
jgi:hypothetical protein